MTSGTGVDQRFTARATCTKDGWTCQGNLCKAGPTANCVPRVCTTANGDQYCGDIGDGCGSTVGCGTTCTKTGWTCQDSLCKAGPTAGCVPLTCTTANGDQYCGTIGDDCGNSLDCGATCAKTGWTCQDNLCKGQPPACTPFTCNPASGGQYCGTIGDGCGNSLDCGTDCSAAGSGWVCGSNNVCVGDATCKPLTCVASSGDNYCGTIGDGCGGTLDCSATCPKDGWVCDQGLCKAGPTAGCVPKTCTTASGDQYCGDIGDGCGSTLHCGTTCAKDGWTCQDNLCKAGPTAGCTPLACTTANGDQYCGDIGDGCGSTDTLLNHLREGRLDLPGPSVQGRADRWLHAAHLRDRQWRPVLRHHRRRLRQLARLRDHLQQERLDLPGQPVQGGADRWLHAAHLQPGLGGPVLRNHRRRLRQLARLRHGLLGCWQRLGVRQQERVRGRDGCVKATCSNAKGVQQYCGTIGDGCGGTLSCSPTCANGVPCGAVTANVCETCGNLCLKQVRCDGGATTSLSGTVYDPAG